MPMRVEWAFAQPPRQILARLAVGSINRLTDKLINEIHDWRVHLPGNHLTAACPFKVETGIRNDRTVYHQYLHFFFRGIRTCGVTVRSFRVPGSTRFA